MKPAGLEDKLLDSLSPGDFHNYLIKLSNNAPKLKSDIVKGLTRQQLLAVCSALESQLLEAVAVLQQHPWDPDFADDLNEDEAKAQNNALLIMKGVAMLAFEIFQECQLHTPDTLRRVAITLHDNGLLALGECKAVQDAVARLCCTWWESTAAGREELVAQSLPYILVRAVDPQGNSRASDVKMCYNMREALSLLDFDDPTIGDMNTLLIHASLHPQFLGRPEGRKFIAYLFNLHPQLARELTSVIRNQAVSNKKSVLGQYGEIAYRAWRGATAACLYEVETTLIQGLMQAAIAADTPTLAASLRTILQGLHSQKRTQGVDSMLLRLYEPILYRAFGSSNSEVRRNALLLMLDAFPIHDPEAPTEETDAVLSKQFKLLRDCLSDDCIAVRTEAIKGACNLLNLYWEIIPAATTATFISTIISDCAYDASSPNIRLAAVNGLRILVENAHAQAVLKKALPTLKHLISDHVVAVRESFVGLLDAVSVNRGMHFYDIVPVDVMLEVMATDVQSVSSRIQQILLPTYFPNVEEGSSRVYALLRAHPGPGQAFCRFLVSSFLTEAPAADAPSYSASVPIEHVLRLLNDIKTHLLATAEDVKHLAHEEAGLQRRKAAKGSRVDRPGGRKAAAGKRRQVEDPGDLPTSVDNVEDQVDDSQLVADETETPEGWLAILGGFLYLCHGVAGAVDKGECEESQVQDLFAESDQLELLLENSPSMEARELVLKVCASLPFLRASEHVCNQLYWKLVQGNMPGLVGEQPTVLNASLACLSAASRFSPRLAAILLHALGARPPPDIPKPEHARDIHLDNSQFASEDDYVCYSCGRPDEEGLLLCDGCRGAYHMCCLQPPVTELPAGDWLCPECETQVQHCSLSQEAAVRCIVELVTLPAPRKMLHQHNHFLAILEALRQLAQSHCDALITRQPLIKTGCSPAHSFCKVALHTALTAMLTVQQAAPAGQEEEEEQLQQQQACEEAVQSAVAAISEGLVLCEQVLTAAQDESNTSDHMECATAVLSVLSDGLALEVLDFNNPALVVNISELSQSLCSLAVTQAETTDDVRPAANITALTYVLVNAVTAALHAVLALAKQLVVVADSQHVSGRAAASEADDPEQLSQQLEHRLNAMDQQDMQLVPAAVEALVQRLMQQLARPIAAPVVTAMRSALASLLASIMDKCSRVPRGWLSAFASSLGSTLASSSDALTVLKSAAQGTQDAGSQADQDTEARRRPGKKGKGTTSGRVLSAEQAALLAQALGPAATALAALMMQLAELKKASGTFALWLAKAATQAWQNDHPAACLGALYLLSQVPYKKQQTSTEHKLAAKSLAKIQQDLQQMRAENDQGADGGAGEAEQLAAMTALLRCMLCEDKTAAVP